MKLIQRDLKLSFALQVELYQSHDKILLGRQLLKMVYDKYAISIPHAKQLDADALRSVRYDGSDLTKFQHKWKRMVADLNFAPDYEVLEQILCKELGKDTSLYMQTMMINYQQEQLLEGKQPDYIKLMGFMEHEEKERVRRQLAGSRSSGFANISSSNHSGHSNIRESRRSGGSRFHSRGRSHSPGKPVPGSNEGSNIDSRQGTLRGSRQSSRSRSGSFSSFKS